MNKWQIDAMVAMLRVLKDLESQKKEKIPTLSIHRPEFTGLSASQIIFDDLLKHEKQLKKESENMKFKVGDEVIFEANDKVLIGNITGRKYLEDKGNLYNIEGDSFQWYNIGEHEIKLFTPKSLLKDGVVATVREGTRFIVFGDRLLEDSRNPEYLKIDNFNDELKQTHPKRHSKYDIIKLEFDGEVIWERKVEKTYVCPDCEIEMMEGEDVFTANPGDKPFDIAFIRYNVWECKACGLSIRKKDHEDTE